MRIHIIAIGGSVMHQLAIALKSLGHRVTGSDDEIYDPSLTKLKNNDLLPQSFGWNTKNIDASIDKVILGMHAKKDNPELHEAQKLSLEIVSYPAFIAQFCKEKTRIVIAGSHGKTTTTSMVMHVLKYVNLDFDYLVGAQVKGFQGSVKLSDAKYMVIEGDEYLSSAVDSRSKFLHYQPDISVITGIAWDHINVFPTYEIYKQTFVSYLELMDKNAVVYAFDEPELVDMLANHAVCGYDFYTAFESDENGLSFGSANYPLKIFGKHNLANLKAAYHICMKLGVDETDFFNAASTFETPDKRMNVLFQDQKRTIIKDFAHAPSKVKATVSAVADANPNIPLYTLLELHTYSSLNKAFLPFYKNALNSSNQALVMYNPKTLEIKKLEALDKAFVKQSFDQKDLIVSTDSIEIERWLKQVIDLDQYVLLIMTSGHLGGIDIEALKPR